MEVSETKLVNFAEKTKFDVSSDYSLPDFIAVGGESDALARLGVTIVFPGADELLEKDGSWNGVDPVYKYAFEDEHGNITNYDNLSDVPDAKPSDVIKVTKALATYTTTKAIPSLRKQVGNSGTISVFQLDPNQLLTVTSGFKVVLRRPLED